MLITSDLHLTASPKDEYRWGLFPWLAEQCQRHKVKTLLILGDLTDAKDMHPAVLVNRIVKELSEVSEWLDQIIILKGNHDWLKENEAFFSFLNIHPKIIFVNEPTVIDHDLFLPYSKSPKEAWAEFDFNDHPFIFMHQTFNGAVSESGQVMQGAMSANFHCHNSIYSGDIHTPQVIGDVTYVGSPYPIRFGDTFKPRCVLRDKFLKERDLHFPTIRREMLDIESCDDLDRPGLQGGDQVKIRLHLSAVELPRWEEHRRDVLAVAEHLGIDVISLELKAGKQRKKLLSVSPRAPAASPEQRLGLFADEQDLTPDILDAGLDIIAA
jgi:DNA repair exonuclease SbcCD nuclease subunit